MKQRQNKDFRCSTNAMQFILKLRIDRIKQSSDLEILSRGRVLELLNQFFLLHDVEYQKLLNMEFKIQ